MKPVSFALLLVLALLIPACDSSTETEVTLGDWIKVTPFKGRPRSGAASFVINNVAYVGLGYDGDEYMTDFYAFSQEDGYWVSVPSFPGTPRERCVSFSIDGKGYVGLGYNREEDQEELGDWWMYDPETNEWTQLAEFGGTARYNAVGFSIGSKGYVGTGYDGDNYNSDFWEYDPSNDEWTEIRSYPGEKIEEGIGFVLNGKGYICAGRNNGLFNTDFWEFDPSAGSWTSRAPDSDDSDYDEFIAAVKRYDASVITLNDKAYFTGGIGSSGSYLSSVYEFDGTRFNWDQMTSFEGSSRSLAVAFTIGGEMYTGTGMNGTKRWDDIWQFFPDEEYDEDN
jgi:N-acetylneuraminic acid mutarotase